MIFKVIEHLLDMAIVGGIFGAIAELVIRKLKEKHNKKRY